MIEIITFRKDQEQDIRKFVLNIQNDEFKLGFTKEEQPDLMDIEHFYREGNFWTALINDEIVGTIGLQKLDKDNGVLRKMFVNAQYRGTHHQIAKLLFDKLFDNAIALQLKTIWLDTPSIALSSHRFYEKNGFLQTNKINLPINYKFPDKNSLIYKLSL